jgi:ArsR family transcriptional regulator, arsenate/arsenite/antimonite-responsive transcriptional repressor
MTTKEQEYFAAIEKFSRIHAALGNPTRLRLFVGALADEHHVSVDSKRLQKDLAELFQIAPSTVSHHFRTLENAGLIKRTRDGQQVTIDLCKEELETFKGFAQTLLEKRKAAYGPWPDLPDDYSS